MQLDKIVVCLLMLFSLTGCGYRWHYDYPEGVRPTVNVPLIYKDEDAGLTSEIISCLNSSGVIQVVPRNGDYRMDVKIVSQHHDQIGYRRDPQIIRGQVTSNLVASEERQTLEVTVTLFHRQTEEIAYGPYSLSASADYDYVDGDSYEDLTFTKPNQVRVEVLPFSLGQLESVEAAREAASSPLFRQLAKKIVDVISSEW